MTLLGCTSPPYVFQPLWNGREEKEKCGFYSKQATFQSRFSVSSTMSTLEHLTTLDIYNDPVAYRKTSIICTIGPKTNNVEKLSALMAAGMNVVRMNFSHGSHEVCLSSSFFPLSHTLTFPL